MPVGQKLVLTDFTGLDYLDSIGGDFLIEGNSSLISLNGLNSLRTVGGDFVLHGNTNIASYDGLDEIERIEGELRLGYDGPVTSLSGFETVEYLGGLGTQGLHTITDFSGFDGLTEEGGNFVVHSGDSLTSLDGLSNLTLVGGNLSLWLNTIVTAIDGLSSLTNVGEAFVLGSANCGDLLALSNLAMVGDKFEIRNCDSITSLDGLHNLTSIGGFYLEISNNEKLEDLSGIDNADMSNVVQMNITYNPQLSNCAVSSLCNYLDGSPVATINIHNNAGGCSSVSEVEYACSFSGLAEFEEIGLAVYPNPTDGRFRVRSIESNNLEFDRMEVIDSNGRLLKSIANSGLFDQDLDLDLNPGIYHIRIVGGSVNAAQRLVVN